MQTAHVPAVVAHVAAGVGNSRIAVLVVVAVEKPVAYSLASEEPLHTAGRGIQMTAGPQTMAAPLR